ncbi:MAG: hypothetical protein RMK57_00780 [Bryobacterales bacterium]|nr:hypothetical protein [Bryobacteraceae bacterium]MDW8353039.1 hypothetical protein [Bryobacterales bacterium]
MSHGVTRKDWRRIAEGMRLDVPEGDLERIAPVLDALEDAFRPLVPALPLETEPAVTFRCDDEELP